MIKYTPEGKRAHLHFSGMATLINQTPAHYAAEKFLKVRQKDSDSLKFGREFHHLLLECDASEKEAYFAKFWQMPDGLTLRSKKGKDWASNHDMAFRLTPAYSKRLANLKGMLTSCESSQVVQSFLRSPKHLKELALEWFDPNLGIYCAGRADLISQDDNGRYRIVDFKTTTNCNLPTFYYSVKEYWYHVQAAMYRDGLMYQLGLDYSPDYTIVAIEKKPPFALRVYHLSDDILNDGYQLYMTAAECYAKCLKSGLWPSYNDTPITLYNSL